MHKPGTRLNRSTGLAKTVSSFCAVGEAETAATTGPYALLWCALHETR